LASLDAFLVPLPGPSPSGVDLRNDTRFHALERQLQPATKAARAQTPGSEPAIGWSGLLESCEELAGEGRDLRLLVVVVRCLAQLDDLPGLAQGLDLLSANLDGFWPTLHPELRDRPSVREAAVRRINALYQLENDEDGLLCDLQHKVLIDARSLGRITGRDLAAASLSRTAFLNEVPKGLSEAEKTTLATNHEARSGRARTACRALAAENPARLVELAEGISATRASLARLEASLSAHVTENGVGVTFGTLSKFLERIAATLSQEAPQGQGQAVAATAAPADVSPAPAPVPGVIGPVTSRQDVEKMLDRIIEFYEQSEPASPIPLLARRLRKMVPMTFLQLMEEMAPSGLKEVRSLAGATDEKAKT
jgi:type VI secretion system protein ImpA